MMKKKSYEHRINESVDDKISKFDGKSVSASNGLRK